MSETIEVKKDIEVKCECSDCGEELTFSGTADNWGDITITVDICDCAKKEE